MRNVEFVCYKFNVARQEHISEGGKGRRGHYNTVKLRLINLLKPTGYGMQPQVEHFNNCTLYPNCVYVFCANKQRLVPLTA
jgi:hypothetical protein